MTLRSWTRKLLAGPVTRPTRKEVSRAAGGARFRPALEALEDRALPSVTFKPAVNYATGGKPQCVAVGDFNGDGKRDLAVANRTPGTVSVLLGKGDGTFQRAADLAPGGSPVSVA